MESDSEQKKDDHNSDVDDKVESVDGDKENSNNKLVENKSKTTESLNEMVHDIIFEYFFGNVGLFRISPKI